MTKPKLERITGTFEFEDGTSHSFSLWGDYGGWSQWGASTDELIRRETGDILNAMVESLREIEAFGVEDEEDRFANMTEEEVCKVASALIAPRTFELTWVARGDTLEHHPEVLNNLLFEDGTSIWDELDEWYSEQEWESAERELVDILEEVGLDADEITDYRDTNSWDILRDEIRERNGSDVINQLINNTGYQVFRANLIDGDEGLELFSTSDEFSEGVKQYGGDPDEYSRDMGEFGEGWSSFELVFRAHPSDFYQHYEAEEFVISEHAYLWCGGGPMNGDGWLVETTRPITIKKSKLSLDSCGWGYSAEKVFGLGLQYDATVTPVTE